MGDGGCEFLFVHRSVADYHHFIEKCPVFFESDVDDFSSVHGDFGFLIPNATEDKHSVSAYILESIAPFAVRACSQAASF